MTHLSKPIESTTPKVNPNVNYRFWVIMTCQYRYLHYNKSTTMVGHGDNKGDCILWGKCIWETLYFLLNFAKAKPALKNKVCRQKKTKKQKTCLSFKLKFLYNF